jgi:hypothetical protein
MSRAPKPNRNLFDDADYDASSLAASRKNEIAARQN